MTPMPPSPSEESAPPPRQRPGMGNLTKDTTESDLWAFDDAELGSGNTIEKSPKATQHFLPIPRESDKMKMRQPKEAVGTKFGGNMDRAKAHVTKPLPVARAESAAEPARPISDFEDLDTWDEPVPSLAEIPGNPEAGAVPVTPQHTHAAEVVPPPSPHIDEQDEFSPPARENTAPVSPMLRLHLSKLEGLGLVALLALLCGAGTVIFFLTIHRLPTKSELAKPNNFPIPGKHLTILSAASHWRAPGPTDTARRGTQLLPVLKLKSSGGPAAIRVFFRNSDGELVGDAVTRLIKTGSELEVVATAGFDDVGMHAAYRNGSSKPWTIEILEAPTENSAGPEFKKLFVMNISTDRR